MVESPIPQDILKYKGKFIANLSVRETVFGALGVGLGLLCFFSWCKGIEDQDMKIFLSFLVTLPFFLVGFVKIYEQPFEKIAFTLLMENFIYPLKRKKEVHYPEFEKYEKTREWIKNVNGEEEIGKEGLSKRKKKPGKHKATPKIAVQKSEVYKGIK